MDDVRLCRGTCKGAKITLGPFPFLLPEKVSSGSGANTIFSAAD
jgi:hypothetical protein